MGIFTNKRNQRGLLAGDPDCHRSLDRARAWIESNSTNDGVWLSSKHQETYREVTGYLIPSLIGVGEGARARQWAESLRTKQQPDGSITSTDGTVYLFDTAQVMRGWLCYAHEDGFRATLERAAEFLHRMQRPDGSFPDPYAGKIPDYIFLYCIEPWRRTGEILARPDIVSASRKCLEYYAGRFDPADFSAHSHFFGYAAEALIDNGYGDLAARALSTAKREIRWTGALRAAQGVRWICGPGQAQFAICFYKTGDLITGDRLLRWLVRHQMPSGGFLGAYGKGSAYFPDAVPSWAVKFFIDAVLWRRQRQGKLEYT